MTKHMKVLLNLIDGLKDSIYITVLILPKETSKTLLFKKIKQFKFVFWDTEM